MTESSPTNPKGSKGRSKPSSRSAHSGRPADDGKTPITVYDPNYFPPETTETQRIPPKVTTRRRWIWISLLVLILLALGAAAQWGLKKRGIVISDLELGFTEKDVQMDSTFAPGQAVYLHFRISGYAVQADKAWIQADVRVLDAQGGVVVERLNVINSSLSIADRKKARLITRVTLPAQLPAGPYTAVLTLRDRFSGKSTEESETLTILSK